MNHDNASESLRASLGRQWKDVTILLLSPLLVVTWWYFGFPRYYLSRWPDAGLIGNDPMLTATVYSFVASFVLLGLIPALVVKFVFRESLADYGVRLGERTRTVRSLLVCAPVILIIAWFASHDPATQAEYPLNRHLASSPGVFGFHAVTYLLLYLGWEFHFRGFVQHGLRTSLGDVRAVLIQTAFSTLAHLGKPTSETYAALLAGLFWGLLAFRTRSLLSGMLQHALLGIALDYFICHR